jgi:hypothetical protein
MGEDWLTQALSNRWALALIAYFLGLLTHWGVSRQAKIESGGPAKGDQNAAAAASEATSENVASSNNNHRSAPSEVQLAAIEAEIREAKALMETEEGRHEAIKDQLASVDAAVKRANGRLKLALRSLNNHKNAD